MRRRLGALNLAQRIILVVALAAGPRVAWLYLVGLSLPSGGWFNYAPDDAITGVTFEAFDGLEVGDWFAPLAIAFIAVWASCRSGFLASPIATARARTVPLNPLGSLQLWAF